MRATDVIEIIRFEGKLPRSKMADILGWTRQRFYAREREYGSIRLVHIKTLLDYCNFRLALYGVDGAEIDYPYTPEIEFDTMCVLLEGCGIQMRILDSQGTILEVPEKHASISGYKQGAWVNARNAAVEKKIDEDRVLYRMWNGKYFVVRQNDDGESVIEKVLSQDEAEKLKE